MPAVVNWLLYVGGREVEYSILEQGLDLMLYGMGTVFVFLTVLVFATRAMSALVGRFEPEPAPVAAQPPRAAAADEQLLAVISAAIHAHRQSRKDR